MSPYSTNAYGREVGVLGAGMSQRTSGPILHERYARTARNRSPDHSQSYEEGNLSHTTSVKKWVGAPPWSVTEPHGMNPNFGHAAGTWHVTGIEGGRRRPDDYKRDHDDYPGALGEGHPGLLVVGTRTEPLARALPRILPCCMYYMPSHTRLPRFVRSTRSMCLRPCSGQRCAPCSSRTAMSATSLCLMCCSSRHNRSTRRP